MNGIGKELFDWRIDKELNKILNYCYFFMVLIMDPLRCIDQIRNSGRLLFNRRFFVVIGDKINVVAKGESSTPEKESVNPPSSCVSVLLWLGKITYFDKRNLIHFIVHHLWGGFVVFHRALTEVFIGFVIFILMFTFDPRRKSVCCRQLGRRVWAWKVSIGLCES